MKKILVALTLVLIIITCLPACGQDKIEENPNFATYNEMFNKRFSNYTIDISTASTNNDVINEKYIVSEENGIRSVSYSIERLNAFIVEGENITPPDGYKGVSTGVYDRTESASAKFRVPAFYFSYTCLGNKEIAFGGSYSTNITSLEKFMGLKVESSDASLNLSFTEESVTSIEISYVTEFNSTVTIKYTFN